MGFDPRQAPNINAVWCGLIVEELTRLGVRDVVVAPGSRNTPLAAALVAAGAESGLRVTPVVDERAAGFFALGCARAGRPAAVVTTSGTAVMNLLPAVTEARRSGAPLLVLSADRPAEMRDCGANQTIDQLGPLKPLVKWQHDLPAPDDRLSARQALTALDEAVRLACAGWPGPVQLNCAFRKPLEPAPGAWNPECLEGLESWLAGDDPFVCELELPAAIDAGPLADRIDDAERGLLVVGNAPDGAAVAPLAARLGWPVIADPGSSLRTGGGCPALIRHAALLGAMPEPDIVLQFGSRPVSRKIEEWLEGLPCERILVDPADERRNPGHAQLTRVTANVADVARQLTERVGRRADSEWTTRWTDEDARIAAVVDAALAEAGELTEARVARDVAAAGERIFAGNSMPIRHLGLFAEGNSACGEVSTSRGASGIDGIVATACGTACGAGEPVVLLIGDLSLLHDLGSLSLVKRSRRKVLVVVINNGGGGIFDHLPVADFPDVMSPFCDGSHEMEFAPVAERFGLPAWRCGDADEWEKAWKQARATGASCLIEAVCPRAGHGELMQKIREGIA